MASATIFAQARSRAAMIGTILSSGLALASPALAKPQATPAPATCKFVPATPILKDVGIEPQLLINATCVDPDYNEKTFVIDKTEQLTFQLPDGGPLVPYTQITGHFPATKTPVQLPAGVIQSPTLFEQKYVLRFPAKEFFKHRSFEQQHPSGGGMVDNRMAFVNGAMSINWVSPSVVNAVATFRHQAAATKVAKGIARRLYDDDRKIYSYFWGCSGGGIVSMAAAENTTGVWDGVQVQCTGPYGVSTYHSFQWQAQYTFGIPKAKRDAIAEAAMPGGTGDIYAGLDNDEKSILNEFLSAGYPLPIIGKHFDNLLPLVDPVDIRLADPSYEDDFWSKPGYAGSKPPKYLKAAKVDSWVTVTGIDRDASGKPTAVHFDKDAFPAATATGDTYLEFWVYDDDGRTRLIDGTRANGAPTENKRRYSLMGILDRQTATLALSGSVKDVFGGSAPITNSPVLLGGLKVGSKVRVNNRFILSIYFYPRHSIIPGMRSYDQYRNANGSPKYPQRKDLSVLTHANYRTMGGRIETGAVKTRTMVLEGRSDNLSWPIFNSSYAEKIARTMGPKADSTMRFYLHDNGRHAAGAGEPGVWQQSIQDLMAWAEKGIAPPKSTAYAIRNGQVIPPDDAAARGGLQPVMDLKVNGGTRAKAAAGQPVTLRASFAMPPKTGMIVQYGWSIEGKADVPNVLAKPQVSSSASRTISFDKPGIYTVRLTVSGQRDGLINPANMALPQNWQEVKVVVE
ncbi:PKD domain-containing protein [Novosphingobium aquae]|uniref:PKD domain-containing protein n=1 Tax=Novosphingobium aquae TaxID=3133435 RepID=A0ABU8S6H6_9SPHN